MGKHNNYSTHRRYFEKLYSDAKTDIKELHIRNNVLQQKINEQRNTIMALETQVKELQRQIAVKESIIEELESH